MSEADIRIKARIMYTYSLDVANPLEMLFIKKACGGDKVAS